MGLDWDWEVYGGERSEETKDQFRPYPVHVYEGRNSWTGIYLTPARYRSAPSSRSSQPKPPRKIRLPSSSIIIISLSPFIPAQSQGGGNDDPLGKPFFPRLRYSRMEINYSSGPHKLTSTSNAYIPEKSMFVHTYIIMSLNIHISSNQLFFPTDLSLFMYLSIWF